jgi:hypothetical protein
MNYKLLCIRDFLTASNEMKYGNGTAASKGVWKDHVCSASSLVVRGRSLALKVKMIADSDKFDNETSYVVFRNRKPLVGGQYDMISICDIATDKVIYHIIPKVGVYDSSNDFKEPVFVGSWAEIKQWFNV